MTSPWLSTLTESVIGAYPTIDKEGSLFFFNQGVHTEWLKHPSTAFDNTGLQLIGVHIGHLWLIEVWSWLVSPISAFNIQMLANLIFNAMAVWWWLDDSDDHQPEWIGLLTAVLLGAQLHVFRDIHWYTIEKSMLFPIFLYWGVLNRLPHNSKMAIWIPILYTMATLLNFYWGILLGLLTLFQYGLNRQYHHLSVFKPIAMAGLVGIALGILQMTLQSDARRFAEATDFLTRASLDIFDFHTVQWNRMEFWQSINIPICLYFGWLLMHRRIPVQSIILGTVFLMLSLGPMLTSGISNPVYTIFSIIPGMWRFAKPEIFFFVPYAIMVHSTFKAPISSKNRTWFWGIVAIFYLVGLYSSPAFPHQSVFVQ